MTTSPKMKEKYQSKIVLIDGHALVHRAFHALPPTFTSPDGVPTNAIFGFASLLLKMIQDLQPDYIAAAFDLAGPTFRHEEFAEYKSHRVKAPDSLYDQIPHIKEILSDFGIPIYEKPGFEADDVIGTLATKFKSEPNLQVVIMTGDLDTLQLVQGDKVVVFTPRKGVTETAVYGEKEVQKRYGIKPVQVADFKGLKGDPSDNIPGVPGIGDKTASELVKKFGSIENLYQEIDKNSTKVKKLTPRILEKLKEFKDQAIFSKRLATIITDVDIELDLNRAEWRKHMDRDRLEAELKKLALFNIIRRLKELDGNEEVQESTALVEAAADPLDLGLPPVDSKSAEKILKGDSIIAFVRDGQILVSDLEAKDVSQVEVQDFKPGKAEIITHDARELIKKLGADKTKNIVFDTKLAAFIINSETRDFTVERLYQLEFGRDLETGAQNLMRAIGELRRSYQEKLKDGRLAYVLEKIELPLSPVLVQMENHGVKVNPKAIESLSKVLNKELASLEKEIYSLAGGEFNINSPQQLSTIIFEKLGLKGKVRKTAKGALSTRASELEKLVDEHPIIEKIMQYREYQKLKTTYVEPFPGWINPKDGRIHTTYNSVGAATGRLSSEDPNLQNIPVRTELGQEFRKAFVADKDQKLVAFDYSQIELRLAAHISGDSKMTEAFEKGEDIHTRTASEIFNVTPEKVTHNMRRQAKVLNFGILYGMGVQGFQRAVKVDRETAKNFIRRYFEEFSGVAKYMEGMKNKAHHDGYVETVFGRRRQFQNINTGFPQLVAMAERMAINHPIQGSAADLLKLAMIEVQKMIGEKYPDSVKMLLQVHDELLFEMDEKIVQKAAKDIKKIMETVHEFSVPIVVDVKVGYNWSEMTPIK